MECCSRKAQWVACGSTTWFAEPRLLHMGLEGHTTLQMRLPIRARHRERGEGYLGLVCSSGNSKFKSGLGTHPSDALLHTILHVAAPCEHLAVAKEMDHLCRLILSLVGPILHSAPLPRRG